LISFDEIQECQRALTSGHHLLITSWMIIICTIFRFMQLAILKL